MELQGVKLTPDIPDTLRREEFLKAIYPGITEIEKRGVKVSVAKLEDYMKKIDLSFSEGKIDDLKRENSDSTVACQIGQQRSLDLILFYFDAGVPVEITEQRKSELAKRSVTKPRPRIGMNFDSFATHVTEGEIKNRSLLPSGFTRSVKHLIGFVKNVNDLNDIDRLCRWINVRCEEENIDKLDFKIELIEGNENEVEAELTKLRNKYNIKPVHESK